MLEGSERDLLVSRGSRIVVGLSIGISRRLVVVVILRRSVRVISFSLVAVAAAVVGSLVVVVVGSTERRFHVFRSLVVVRSVVSAQGGGPVYSIYRQHFDVNSDGMHERLSIRRIVSTERRFIVVVSRGGAVTLLTEGGGLVGVVVAAKEGMTNKQQITPGFVLRRKHVRVVVISFIRVGVAAGVALLTQRCVGVVRLLIII